MAGDLTARQNMLQLIQLRWIAVFGQVVTIIFVHRIFGIRLPIGPMSWVLAALIVLNISSLLRLRRPQPVRNPELFAALVLDALALTLQLYLSGGASNPFTSLYLLQVILGAVLLEVWSTWAMVVITVVCFLLLTVFYQPLQFHQGEGYELFGLHMWGMLIGFTLDAGLLVFFVTRINANLRARDAGLADLRQRASEEDHIVRMGLLASGAAHELGTPLATLDVILGDWARMPNLAADPDLAQEIADMRDEVRRCKTIVTGVLQSAGEARGEALAVTTLSGFLDTVVAEWVTSRGASHAVYENQVTADLAIVSDSALKQVIHNVLDNALEASPNNLVVAAARKGDLLILTVRDAGPGFSPEMLANFGRPYHSTKGRPGGGLGLFLVVNVLRKFGGEAKAQNRPDGGALVTLTLPLSALRIEARNGV